MILVNLGLRLANGQSFAGEREIPFSRKQYELEGGIGELRLLEDVIGHAHCNG